MAELSITIEISPNSKECIFAGNLLKAPPLNRRGRKKWHERYLVLRANRTLETFKSRKAALSHKSPRRVIDLRSCINMELGLEYKNLQHILSIGTFERTFFFAAPSDPLMLQWGYLLEKTKNAQDGEVVEVLDIGLRKSRDKPAVHRVKPNQPTFRHSLGSPQKTLYSTFSGSKSGISLANFSRESSDTINLRASPPETSHGLTESGLSDQSDQRESSCSEYSTTSSVPSPSHVIRGASHVTVIPNRVPPPAGVLATAKRNKDGYFVAAPKKSSLDSPAAESAQQGGRPRRKKDKVVFVEKPGSLHRGRAMKAGTSRHTKNPTEPTSQYCTPNPSLTGTPNDKSETLHLHSNMKRSFRYRKITLRHEQPLFHDDKQSDSEDEGEKNSSGDESHCSSLPAVEISEEHIKKAGTTFALSPVPKETPFELSSSAIPKASANRYSKVTIGGLRPGMEPGSESLVPAPNSRNRACSQPSVQLDRITPTLDHMISLSQEESRTSSLEGSLPARPPSDCAVYASRDSLDDILVEPPEMFNPNEPELHPPSKEIKPAHEIVGHVYKGANHMIARIIPSPYLPPSDAKSCDNHVTDGPDKSCDNQVTDNRNSTESNDTGYTSGASPALNDSQLPHVDIGEFQLSFKERGQSTIRDESLQEEEPKEASSNQIVDSSRNYIPLVFYSRKPNVLLVQVCLVETADELIKDLVSLKAIESFSLLECDEIHGNDNVSAVSDDFIVETSLEDLEFGFGVERSTQKDLFSRKVRESTFEIQNLFGTRKPFSCDVMIRHADEMIVMPIEIEI